jgi:hypothetical protein
MSQVDFMANRWLVHPFMGARGLPAPDGRPLYAYRCVDAELETIADSLRRALRGNPDLGTHISALFCLFAAEWWRRNYKGGPWSWEPIFAMLGVSYDWNIARQLTDAGIRYWRRPLRRSRSGREFLLTLILEAGLPLRVVQDGRGLLAGYLKRVLADLDRFGAEEDTARRLAASHAGMLPKSLRTVEMFALAAELMLAAFAVREQLPQDLPPRDAIPWLDAHSAGWRELFPLAVDDDAARELLAGLIRETVTLRQRGKLLGNIVERILTRSDGGWLLEAVFRVDGLVPPGALSGLEKAQTEGSTRARIFAAGSIEASISGPIALARLEGDGPERRWRFEPLSGSRDRIALGPDHDLRLRVVSAGRDLAISTAPGGGPMPPAPWIFAPSEGEPADDPSQLKFIGGGSVRSQHPFLYVACESPQTLLRGEEGTVSPIGKMLGTEYELHRVSGSVRASQRLDGLQIIISTGHEEERAERLLLRGRTPRWRTDGLAFLGTPEFWETRDGNINRRARREDIRWLPAGDRSGRWRPLVASGLPPGPIDVVLVKGNEIVDRQRLAVLPGGMSIRIRPVDARRGSVEASGLADAEVLVERSSGLTVDLTRIEEQWRIGFEASAEPPGEVTLVLSWPDDRGRLCCRLPFPARGGGFIDATGHWLRPQARITLESLYGIRAIAPPDTGEGVLFGWLQAQDIRGGRSLWVRRRFTDECPLSSLRQVFLRLLASSQELDASILLVVQGDGENPPVRLSRLDLSLNVLGDEVTIDRDLTAILTPAERSSIELFCRPIGDFSKEDEPLPTVASSEPPRWSFVPGGHEAGTWLLFGRVGGRYRIRPKVIAIDPIPQPDYGRPEHLGIGSLAQIPDFAQRRLMIADRLNRICMLPADEDWAELDRALQGLQGRLPLATLDYFCMLADNPPALLMFLARATGAGIDAVLQMEDELPFCWPVLPLQAWFSAFERSEAHQRQVLSVAGIEMRYADEVIARTLAQIADELPILSATVALVRERLHQVTNDDANILALRQPSARSFVESMLKEMRMNALRRNSDAIWPAHLDFREFGLLLPAAHLEHAEHCRPLLDAPFAAAAAAASNGAPKADFVRAVLQCREFDPLWFEEAYPYALILAFAPNANTSVS